MWVPLHVTDAPHGLHLGAAGAVLIEMPELALLQHVLAATVAGELVTHPTAERERAEEGRKEKMNMYIFKLGMDCRVAGRED